MYYVPKLPMRREIARELRGVWEAPIAGSRAATGLSSRNTRRPRPSSQPGWRPTCPKGLTVFALPAEHRRRLRTSNPLERLNEEIKRRTRVATLFPNAASLLRLVTAILQETSEDWETGKTYLTMETN